MHGKIGVAKCIIVMSVAFAAGATLVIFAGQYVIPAMICFLYYWFGLFRWYVSGAADERRGD